LSFSPLFPFAYIDDWFAKVVALSKEIKISHRWREQAFVLLSTP
jgi:hypothetical protein